MRYALFTTMSLGLCTLVLASGCKKEDDQPPPNTAAYPQQQPYQQGGYQQQQPGAYPQQQPGAYPQQQPATYPQATPTAQPTAAGASPQPNALATACRSDADCIGARCNLQAQKCQFPCGSNNDCQTGWACTLGACAPNLNTQPH
jgi:hypothetical protein